MKNYPTNYRVALVLALWLSVKQHGLSQTPESLDQLIAESLLKGRWFEEDLMEKAIVKWDGYNTAAGLNLIIDKHLTDGIPTEINIACHHLLEGIGLTKAEIATAMMERARKEAMNDEEPWRLVYVLRQMEEMIDREKQGKEVVAFIAEFLKDKRPTEPNNRGPESVPRQPRRVCDGATSALVHYLEETKLCDICDVRFGNPGGEYMMEKRDEVTRAVVKVLQEKGLLAENFWSTLPPPILPKAKTEDAPGAIPTDSKLPQKQTPEAAQTPAGAKPESTSNEQWSRLGLIIAAAVGMGWLWFKRGKKKSL